MRLDRRRHSHFDHLFGAERIARNTGARIIGSYETVRVKPIRDELARVAPRVELVEMGYVDATEILPLR